MPDLHDSAYIVVGDRGAWVRPPDAGLVQNWSGWGEDNSLINGSRVIQASPLQTRRFTLKWTVLHPAQFDVIHGLFAFAGAETVHYYDRTFLNRSVVSPLLDRPYLHIDAWSPLAVSHYGTRLARTQVHSSPPYKQVVFPAVPADDRLDHSYEETIWVPPGYGLRMSSLGINPERSVQLNDQALAPTGLTVPGSPNGATKATVAVKYPGTASTLRTVTGEFFPLSDPLTGVVQRRQSDAAGFLPLRVVPDSIQVEYKGGTQGWRSYQVELSEVWPWQ